MTAQSTTEKLPSAFSLIKLSAYAVRRNIAAFALLVGVPYVLLFFSSLMAQPSIATDAMAQFKGIPGVLYLSSLVLLLLGCGGVTLTAFRSINNKDAEPLDMLQKGLPYVWRIICVGIATWFILTISLVLFVVPFFFVLHRFILAPYYVVDKNLGVIEAMKMSAAQSKGYGGAIWGMFGVGVLLFIPAVVLTGVSPVVGLIASMLAGCIYAYAPAIRYLQIQKAVKA